MTDGMSGKSRGGGVVTTAPAVYHGTTKDPTWCTPRWLVAAAAAIIGRPFMWDLAATPASRVAPRHLGPGGWAPDALLTPWDDARADGPAWLNPPWSRMCSVCPGGRWTSRGGDRCSSKGHTSIDKGHWLAKIAHEGAKPCTRDGAPLAPLVVLLPYTPATKGFLRCVLGCHAQGRHPESRAAMLLTIPGRVRFERVDEVTGERLPAAGAGFDACLAIYRGPWPCATARGVLRRDGSVCVA